MPSQVDLYMFPHLGLGDAIIVNGLVRHFCEQYNNLVLFCSNCYYENIKWFYRDLKNLTLMPFGSNPTKCTMEDAYQIRNYIQSNNLQDKVIYFGFEMLDDIHKRTNCGLHQGFYKSCGFDPFLRFDNFYYERNHEYENYVYEKLNPTNEKYIFVIDDSNHHLGNFIIDNKRIQSEYKIIKYNKELNYNDDRFLMFNYYKILENAEEIHTLETAFFEFMQLIKIPKPKIYVHSYLKKYMMFEQDWNFFLSKHTNNYTFLNS